MRLWLFALIMLITPGLVTLAHAQGTAWSASSTTNGNVISGTVTMSGSSSFPGPPVTGAPFSAQRINEHVQVAADGTRFDTGSQQEKIYRDSMGRVRTERSLMMLPNPPTDGPVMIEIQDPVAGYTYTLDVQNKVAHRTAMQMRQFRQGVNTPANTPGTVVGTGGVAAAAPAVIQQPAPATASGAKPRMQGTQESLGTQVIEGVIAEGQRIVTTWPAGAVGNNRQFQTVSELWISPDLQETVLSKHIDPRSGESTMKLVNISRDEPSPDLFQPPPTFQVVDETGSFQIHWTATRQQQ